MFVFILLAQVESFVFHCSQAKTQTECLPIINNIHQCIWHENQCQILGCAQLQAHDCTGQVVQGDTCLLNDNQCLAVANCQDLKLESHCTLLKPNGISCHWDGLQCIHQTCEHTQCQNEVVNKQRCSLDGNRCISDQSCESIKSAQECISPRTDNIKCYWGTYDGKCKQLNCKGATTRYECYALKTYGCFDSDYTNSENIDCRDCSDFGQDQCSCELYSIFGCKWNNGKCVFGVQCNQITDQVSCQKASSCTWYATNQCVTNQEAVDLDRKCDIYSYGSIFLIGIISILF